MNELGRVVKEKRKDAAMNQDEFAQALGITSSTVSRVERGEIVGAKTLRALSEYLQIPTRILRSLMHEGLEQK